MIFNNLKNILIPIDFNINTEFLVKQAIELANTTSITIHLLHVVKSERSKTPAAGHTPFSIINNYGKSNVMNKLEEWKQAIEETIPESTVKIHLAEGSVHENIINTAKKIQPQLIIIGKKRKHSFFRCFRPLCPNEISKITGCPVLAIISGTTSSKMQNIVVPVRSFIPNRKIELLLVFAKMYRAKIHLVAVQNKMGAGDAERNALLNTYRLLKTVLPNSIEYHLLNSNNFPKATLKYAESIGADMMFVNPGAETKISFLTGQHINEVLSPSSKIKILFVEPLHDK
jgi:nucleotide-binding universal stress UspA family protein